MQDDEEELSLDRHGGVYRMLIGFTGTQIGMTNEQAKELWRWLIAGDVLHHGDCVGADYTAWYLARKAGLQTICHPPVKKNKRANTSPNEETRPPYEYLDRNHNIVDETEILIATPKGFQEELRSGTWATVRYAKNRKRMVIVIYPNGSVERWQPATVFGNPTYNLTDRPKGNDALGDGYLIHIADALGLPNA